MGTKSLIINIGNTSKRYSFFDDLEEVAFFNFERGSKKPAVSVSYNNSFDKTQISNDDYEKSLIYLLNYSRENLNIDIDDVFVIGFRVFGNTDLFLNHKEIDDTYLSILNSKEIDFRHDFIDEILRAKKIFENHRIFAVSDHDFHKTNLPEANNRFSHYGLSIESLVDTIKELEGSIPPRTIICHLGAKISVTALLNGKSLDTSMHQNFVEEQDTFDIKTLQEEAFRGSKQAQLAIKSYVYNILKKITEMITVTKGIDCLVFTGTAGFRSEILRELILDELKWLDIYYSAEENSKNNLNSEYFHIETPDSKVKIIVADTKEMKQIAKKTLLNI